MLIICFVLRNLKVYLSQFATEVHGKIKCRFDVMYLMLLLGHFTIKVINDVAETLGYVYMGSALFHWYGSLPISGSQNLRVHMGTDQLCTGLVACPYKN